MDIKEIKNDFVVDATDHHLAILEGDHKKANRLHKKLMKLYKQAKNMECLNIFLEFLDHSNEGVILWAATFLLNTNSEVAVRTLNKLTLHPTIVSMDAKMILELWKKGELELL